MPPLGVRLIVDVQAREGARGTTYYARVRWTHPVTHHREGVKRTHGSLEERGPGSNAWRVPPERVSTQVSPSPTMSPSWEIGGLAGSIPRRRWIRTRRDSANACCPRSGTSRCRCRRPG
jgi:hypothetical protein